MSARLRRALAGEAGFTLIEVLIATLLMTVILAALATVTAQWLPNWNGAWRGCSAPSGWRSASSGSRGSVGRGDDADQWRRQGAAVRGGELSVTFVRTAVGPNTRPGLEIIRLIEKADNQGLALVRERDAVRADAGRCADKVRRPGRADPRAVSAFRFPMPGPIRSGKPSGAGKCSFRT
jgi:general secretion pathway protein J